MELTVVELTVEVLLEHDAHFLARHAPQEAPTNTVKDAHRGLPAW